MSESAEKTRAELMKPPKSITLIYCPACGKDDRFNALWEAPRKHYSAQGLCPGKPIKVVYVPER